VEKKKLLFYVVIVLALIACGGIHSVAQAEQVLAAGARAVQLDGAVWVEPGLATLLAAELAGQQRNRTD